VDECLFCKIAAKEIPAHVVYEDDAIVAFLDIKPVHPGHTLVIAKHHSPDVSAMDPVDLQAAGDVCQRIVRALLTLGADGANIITNVKPAGHQVIFHTHFHVIPRHEGDGLKMWPQAPYPEGEAQRWLDRVRGALR
jgi:histidine triad (HIT) family protein